MVYRFNHGQTCSAGTRVFVHEDVYEKFLAKFTETLKVCSIPSPLVKRMCFGLLISITIVEHQGWRPL